MRPVVTLRPAAAALAVCLSASPAVSAQVPAPSSAMSCAVARVIDGDTFVCAAGVRQVTVRLLGVDAPEMRQAPFGDQARNWLVAAIPAATTVTLDLDVRTTDRYGRVLAYVWTAGGLMVNEALLGAGFAAVAVEPPNVKYVTDLRAVAERARSTRAGLWSTPAFECLPADFRRQRCR